MRRKPALRGEAYAWVLDLRSLDKLREVGDLSYLGFILYLSVFTMFELIEIVNGRLIRPKTWDRIVRIFLSHWIVGVDVRDCLGIKFINLCYKSCVGLYNAGNGYEFRVHKVNRRLVIF